MGNDRTDVLERRPDTPIQMTIQRPIIPSPANGTPAGLSSPMLQPHTHMSKQTTTPTLANTNFLPTVVAIVPQNSHARIEYVNGGVGWANRSLT
jgi:hypothetical protein